MYKLCLLLIISSLSFAIDAIVINVVDGDTLHVEMNGKEEKIRILYIDTPEKFGGAKLEKDAKKAGISIKDEINLGKLSSGYASKFFQKGDKVIIDIKKKDKYGRNLSTISKNEIDYSTQIIKDGYSCIYKKAPYPKELDNALITAKDKKIGLWGINYDTMSKLCK